MNEKKQIAYHPGYIRKNREQAIGDIFDALVEIITNCDDSYHRLSRDGGDILISVERRRIAPSLIAVKDRAEGMTLVDMEQKLANVGKRTAGAGSRGFMARGLRDCLILGDIKVESIVDECYYACNLLKSDDTFNVLSKGSKVNAETRVRMGTKKNGTTVTIHCESGVKLPRFETLVERLPLHYALRDILSPEKKVKVYIQEGGRKKALVAPSLQGEKKIDEFLKIEGYPQVAAHLRIWKAKTPLSDLAPPRMRKSGILVVGKRAIHQCTHFGYENRESAAFYYGRLDCDYIQQLLDEYESREERGEQHPPDNNVLLVDPNRQAGLKKQHHFAKKLFPAIDSVIKQLIDEDKANAAPRGDIANTEMRKRLDKLAKFADKFLREYVEQPSASNQDAIDAARKNGVYILPPVFNIGIGKVRTLTVYVDKAHYDPKRKTRTRSTNDQIIGLEKTFSTEELHPHRSEPDMYIGSCKVRGITPGTADIVVRPSKHSQATAKGVVVKECNENWRDFENPLEFGSKRYEIPEEKSKIVKVFADTADMPKNDMVAYVSCPGDKDNSLSIGGGGQCPLTPQPGTNYAVGELRITGRNVIPRALTLQARMGRFNATAKVKVVPLKVLKGGFSFKLVDESEGLGESRAQFDLENDPNLLLIAGTHPSIADYFGSAAEKFPLQNEELARAVLAEIITDSICMRILQDEMREKSGDFQYEGYEPHDVLAHIRGKLRSKIHKFSVQAHKILVRSG